MKRRTHKKSRIFLLDDHPMTRRGLIGLINSEPDLVVCGEAGDAQKALAAMTPPLPDLVVADITIPGKSGLDFIRDLHYQHPQVPVLALSMHHESIYAERVLRAGARGYIMKVEGGEKLLKAIRRVLRGDIYVSEEMSAVVMNLFFNGRSKPANAGVSALTDREFDVFQLIGQGLSTRQICKQLGLSVPTVGTHRKHIKEKLKLGTGAELVQRAAVWAASQQLV